jgi:hypothetical protein
MAIALAVSGRPQLLIDSETITIGSDPANSVVLTGDDRIKPRHAVIRRVAGRWLVEAREGESFQVGSLEPARLHWLSPGDVIRLVPNGPEITFQPPDEKPPAAASQFSPVTATIPLPASPAPPPFRPSETIAPAPTHDPLFAPLTEPIEPPPVPRRQPAAERTPPAAAPPQRARRTKPPGGDSLADKIIREGGGDVDPYRIAEESKPRPAPMLRRGEGLDDGRSAPSESAFGWTIIWILVGLGALLIVAVIWFGGSAASGSDYRPASLHLLVPRPSTSLPLLPPTFQIASIRPVPPASN